MNRRSGRQRGFLGLIVILIALLIVAWLSMDALKEYGVMSGLGPAPKAAPAAEPARGPGIAGTDSREVTTATPAPVNALDKARGLESAVREQAADQSRRIDEATK
jgi:uncharacterized caspase-like protein